MIQNTIKTHKQFEKVWEKFDFFLERVRKNFGNKSEINLGTNREKYPFREKSHHQPLIFLSYCTSKLL